MAFPSSRPDVAWAPAELAKRGVLIRWESMRSIAEEAPGAYKDVTAVVEPP